MTYSNDAKMRRLGVKAETLEQFGAVSEETAREMAEGIAKTSGAEIGIAEPMVPGIAIGIVGMLMVIANYPIYKTMLGSRRKKYAEKIIALSDNIMKG